MTLIRLRWKRFENFFDLWRNYRTETQMIYSIGETSHCYIGCIGIRDGQGGLRQRYQWQYVHRSLAIFATEESKGQVAFAAKFVLPGAINKVIIKAAEALVQQSFIQHNGEKNALFKPASIMPGYEIEHIGILPAYLVTANKGVN